MSCTVKGSQRALSPVLNQPLKSTVQTSFAAAPSLKGTVGAGTR
ncbi:MAG: hypothetical protein V3U93_11480 [Alphaproteobacteria bacterium]